MSECPAKYDKSVEMVMRCLVSIAASYVIAGNYAKRHKKTNKK